jgi:hypothetical protein
MNNNKKNNKAMTDLNILKKVTLTDEQYAAIDKVKAALREAIELGVEFITPLDSMETVYAINGGNVDDWISEPGNKREASEFKLAHFNDLYKVGDNPIGLVLNDDGPYVKLK